MRGRASVILQLVFFLFIVLITVCFLVCESDASFLSFHCSAHSSCLSLVSLLCQKIITNGKRSSSNRCPRWSPLVNHSQTGRDRQDSACLWSATSTEKNNLTQVKFPIVFLVRLGIGNVTQRWDFEQPRTLSSLLVGVRQERNSGTYVVVDRIDCAINASQIRSRAREHAWPSTLLFSNQSLFLYVNILALMTNCCSCLRK